MRDAQESTSTLKSVSAAIKRAIVTLVAHEISPDRSESRSLIERRRILQSTEVTSARRI